LREGFKFARAVRYYELRLYSERFEYFLNSRQTSARPASPSCGIDKDDHRMLAESAGRIGAIPHAFSLML